MAIDEDKIYNDIARIYGTVTGRVVEKITKYVIGLLEEHAAQQSVQRIVGYAGPSEHGTYPGHEVGCICGLCVSTPANR